MWQVLLEALIDSAKMIPFLLAIYLKTGTLLAVLIASSDEALPLLLTSKSTFLYGLILLASKFVFAVIVGFIANIFDQRPLSYDFSVDTSTEGCCQHDMHDKPNFWQFVKHPLIHTAKIFAYVLVINALFGVAMYFFADAITVFMQQTYWLQPLVCGLVGLIPNCAGSVILAGLFADGLVSFGALATGLVCSSGLAFTILLKNKSTARKTPLIALALYLSSLLFGYAINLIALAV